MGFLGIKTKKDREHELQIQEQEQAHQAELAKAEREAAANRAAQAEADKLHYEDQERQRKANEKRRSAEELARIKAEAEKQAAEIERQTQLELAEKEREQKLQAILAMNSQETASNAERWKLEEGPAFSIHDIDAENKFLQTKLLEKWDDIFQKQNIIDELRFFENAKEKKRFIADTFSIELTCSYTWSELTSDIWNEMKSDTNCLELIYDLELVYESQEKQLFFKFSEKEDSDSDFELSFEYKPDQTSDNIKAVITGTADNPTKYTTLYNFLCSLDLPEIVEHMDVFFTKLKEAEQKLPNKKEIELNEKYSSILDSLSTL